MDWNSSPDNSDEDIHFQANDIGKKTNSNLNTPKAENFKDSFTHKSILSTLNKKPHVPTIPDLMPTSANYNKFVFSQNQTQETQSKGPKKSKKLKNTKSDDAIPDPQKKRKQEIMKETKQDLILKKTMKKRKNQVKKMLQNDDYSETAQMNDSTDDSASEFTNQLFSQFRDSLVEAKSISSDTASQHESAQSTCSIDTTKLNAMRLDLDSIGCSKITNQTDKPSGSTVTQSKNVRSDSMGSDDNFKTPNANSKRKVDKNMMEENEVPMKKSKLSLIKHKSPDKSSEFDKSDKSSNNYVNINDNKEKSSNKIKKKKNKDKNFEKKAEHKVVDHIISPKKRSNDKKTGTDALEQPKNKISTPKHLNESDHQNMSTSQEIQRNNKSETISSKNSKKKKKDKNFAKKAENKSEDCIISPKKESNDKKSGADALEQPKNEILTPKHLNESDHQNMSTSQEIQRNNKSETISSKNSKKKKKDKNFAKKAENKAEDHIISPKKRSNDKKTGTDALEQPENETLTQKQLNESDHQNKSTMKLNAMLSLENMGFSSIMNQTDKPSGSTVTQSKHVRSDSIEPDDNFKTPNGNSKRKIDNNIMEESVVPFNKSKLSLIKHKSPNKRNNRSETISSKKKNKDKNFTMRTENKAEDHIISSKKESNNKKTGVDALAQPENETSKQKQLKQSDHQEKESSSSSDSSEESDKSVNISSAKIKHIKKKDKASISQIKEASESIFTNNEPPKDVTEGIELSNTLQPTTSTNCNKPNIDSHNISMNTFIEDMLTKLNENKSEEDNDDENPPNSCSSDSMVQEERKNTKTKPKDRVKIEDHFQINQELSDEDCETLKYLTVLDNFELPDLHRLEVNVVRPTQEVFDQINALGLEVKKGNYTPDETKIIEDNWIDFCKVHKVDPKPHLFFHLRVRGPDKKPLLDREECIKFVRYLARGLPNRMLCSVYKRFTNIYVNVKRGKFTSNESNIIMETVRNTTNARNVFARLGKELNRDRLAVEKHYIWLREQGKHDFKQDRIRHYVEGSAIVRMLLKEMKCKDVHGLKYLHIPYSVYAKIGLKLQVRPTKIQQYWLNNLHPKFFVTGSRAMWEVKAQLFSLIRANPEFKTLLHVNYNDFIPQMDGWTTSALGKILRNSLRALKDSGRDTPDFRDQLALCAMDTGSEKKTLQHAYFEDDELIVE